MFLTDQLGRLHIFEYVNIVFFNQYTCYAATEVGSNAIYVAIKCIFFHVQHMFTTTLTWSTTKPVVRFQFQNRLILSTEMADLLLCWHQEMSD